MAAPTSAADAIFPHRAACFSTSTSGAGWLQTEHNLTEAKDQAVQQLMVEVLPQLEPLGVTPQLLRKVLTCRGWVLKASTAHLLKDRFQNIHQLAAADTNELRTAVNKQLSYVPRLLTLQPRQVAANASGLRDILCQQFEIPPTVIQQLITKQISVLTRKPQSVADKLQVWASILQLDVASVVQDIWCKHIGKTLDRSSNESVTAAVQQLQSVLHLGTGDVLHLALTVPHWLGSASEHKLRLLTQLLGSYGWTQEQLGQAVMKYPKVIALSADSLNHKWKVFHQYAAAHPPSQQQLQDRCKDSCMLRMFMTTKLSIQLMQYITQYHGHAAQQWQDRPVSSLASITQQLEGQIGQHRRRRKQSRVGSSNSSATTLVPSVAGPARPCCKRPLVWRFTGTEKYRLVELAVDYPGFWGWLKQQQG